MSLNLPANLYTANEVRELDRIAIEEKGIPGSTLMARAAEALFSVLSEHWPHAKKIAVVCGLGNNAGDGLVLARIAQPLGWDVSAILVGDPEKFSGDCLEAYEYLQGTKATIKPFEDDDFTQYDLIVDAIFGSGLNRNVEGPFARAIENINRAARPVLAIDIPSGISADTGRVMSTAVKADITVTFIGLKRGLFTADGPEYAGRLFFNALEVPPDTYEPVKTGAVRLNLKKLLRLLPPRPKNSHKGDFGHVLVMGGELGMSGAARMACEAALRTGAGLVSLATRPEHATLVNIGRPEIMSYGINEGAPIPPLKRATVIALGPGLGQDAWGEYIYRTALQSHLPLVLDADGLNLLAKNPVLRSQWVLTPHPGEAARLLECSAKEVQADRFAAVKKLYEKYKAVIVLKGCGSLVYDGQSEIGVCTAGNPGMASGGMGDTLTGIIAGLIAQRLSLSDAAKLGTCLHATAADLAAREGERGLLAGDLFDHIRRLVKSHE